MSEDVKPSEGAREALKSVLAMSDTSLEAAALELDAFAQQREHAAYERGKAEGREAGKQEERGRIREALNDLITQYIKSPGIGFSDTMTAKMALEEAINIVNQE